jgi:hypothetical protein
MITFEDIVPFIRDPSPERRPLIDALIAGVISEFEKATNRLWTRRTNYVIDVRPERYQRNLYLRLFPIVSATVKEAEAGGTLETVDADEYDIREPIGVIERVSAAEGAERPWLEHVQVTTTGGYTAAPSDVKVALATQVSFLLKRLDADKIDVQSVSTSAPGGGGGTTRFMDPVHHPIYAAAIQRKRYISFG